MKPIQNFFVVVISMIVFSGSAGAAKRSHDKAIVNSDSFISGHPDLMFRMRGIEAYKKKHFIQAFVNFKRAAKFADKPSQGMMAEMLWKGEGVQADKIEAYVWMDIAAERSYPTMLLSREKMWSQLSESERIQAIAKGLEIYKYYGDDVAKVRLERVLRRARNNVTGSRVGFVGALTVCLNPMACTLSVDGSQYYQDKFWKPEQYWQWQDIAWKSPRSGKVEVLPFEVIPNTKDRLIDKK